MQSKVLYRTLIHGAADSFLYAGSIQHGPEERLQRGQIRFPVHHVAQPMSRARHDQQLLAARCAVHIVFVPHVAGDEAVVLAVEEEDGRVAVRHGPGGGGLLRVKAAEEAARAAFAHDFIVEMPEGYDTIIGERGLGLPREPSLP